MPVKLLFIATVSVLLCTSCVSRTTYKKTSLRGDNPGGKPIEEKKLIWFWQDEFKNP